MWEEDSALEAAISGEIGGLGGDVTLGDLFSDEWMDDYTAVASIGEFLAASEYEVTDQESFEEIPDAAWDDHVASHSEFEDWGEMLAAAVESYVADGPAAGLERTTEVGH
jgi:hypothetical protein